MRCGLRKRCRSPVVPRTTDVGFPQVPSETTGSGPERYQPPQLHPLARLFGPRTGCFSLSFPSEDSHYPVMNPSQYCYGGVVGTPPPSLNWGVGGVPQAPGLGMTPMMTLPCEPAPSPGVRCQTKLQRHCNGKTVGGPLLAFAHKAYGKPGGLREPCRGPGKLREPLCSGTGFDQ